MSLATVNMFILHSHLVPLSNLLHHQVEEEEYATRYIHYFSSGLLTLPEGKTLRSSLADKLHCDPMRITKKYAGASCLGNRISRLCDRPKFSVQDVEAARREIEQLERRFKLRLRSGIGVILPLNGSPVEDGSAASGGGSVYSFDSGSGSVNNGQHQTLAGSPSTSSSASAIAYSVNAGSVPSVHAPTHLPAVAGVSSYHAAQPAPAVAVYPTLPTVAPVPQPPAPVAAAAAAVPNILSSILAGLPNSSVPTNLPHQSLAAAPGVGATSLAPGAAPFIANSLASPHAFQSQQLQQMPQALQGLANLGQAGVSAGAR